MNNYKQFTEQHEALYTYFNAYITSGNKNIYYVTVDQIKDDLREKFGFTTPDSFFDTGLGLLEVNVNAEAVYGDDGALTAFKGLCFAKDYAKFRAIEVGE